MKNPLLLAATLLTGLILSAGAHATNILDTDTEGLLSSGNTGVFNSAATSGINTYDYLLSGQLNADTQIAFTVAGTQVQSFFGSPFSLVFGGSVLPSGSNYASYVSGLQAGTLPAVQLANIGTATSPVYQFTLTNLSNTANNFVAYFAAMIDQAGGGNFAINYTVSSVPLPASVVLFGSALLMMAGFASFKKARNRA